MKTIIVNKFGGTFRTRESLSGASATGEQGETEGIIRHLLERNDCRIIYFGKYNGEPLCTVVQPDFTPWAEHDTPELTWTLTDELQRAGWELDYQHIKDVCEDVVCVLCVNGLSPTFSHVGNPKGAIVQASGIKYAAPTLALLENLKVPRVCVNNDPRTYPKDQEMSFGWEWARPRALLDQCAGTVSTVVGGRRYTRVSAYAACESHAWMPIEAGLPLADRVPCQIVAHAHIADGCRERGRDKAWACVLDDQIVVLGAGWEHFSGYDARRFLGKIKPSEVQGVFAATACSPCVAAAPGFYTGKPWVMMSRGCVPILFGNGTNPYTWDPNGLLEPLDSPTRAVRPGDLARIVQTVQADWTGFQEVWKERLKPRWSLFDEVIDKLLDGTFEQCERYGGYE